MPLSDKTNHQVQMITRRKPNNKAKLRKFGVKIVIKTLVIKQNISKMKFTKPTELRRQPHTHMCTK